MWVWGGGEVSYILGTGRTKNVFARTTVMLKKIITHVRMKKKKKELYPSPCDSK